MTFKAVFATWHHCKRFTSAARMKYPISPHLSIYRPQITWVLSIGHRMSGALLGGVIYASAIGYAIDAEITKSLFIRILSPTPSQNESNSMIERLFSLRTLFKSLITAPLVFHTANGIRHLVWDCGYGFSIGQVKKSGWSVVGITALSTFFLSIK